MTGAPGWLGTRFVEALTRGFDGQAPSGKDRRVRCLVLDGVEATALERLGAEVVRGDVRDLDSLKRCLDGMESVFHLAGVIHPGRPRELFAVNTRGTENVLTAAIAAGAKRFIYVSSNAVGGIRRWRRIMAESEPDRPYMSYGKSKWLAEQSLKRAHERGQIEAVILRPCWFYGPGQPARQTRFFKMIKAGNPIVFGDGRNLRSMSYLDNTVQALQLAEVAPRAAGQLYWIADERPYSTLEIYETVARLLDVKQFKPRFVPGLVSELCMYADAVFQALGFYQTEIHVAGEMNKDIACLITKAKQELGYRPQVELEEGMRRSIRWCRQTGQKI